MATLSKNLADIIEEWARRNDTDIIDIEQAAEWAVTTGQYVREPISPKKQCEQDMRRALQQATHLDPQGNKVRTKHAVRKWKGQQTTLWPDVRTGKPDMINEAFRQNHQRIANDVKRHSIEKQSYDLNNLYGVVLPSFDYNFNKEADEAKMSGEYDDSYDDDPNGELI